MTYILKFDNKIRAILFPSQNLQYYEDANLPQKGLQTNYHGPNTFLHYHFVTFLSFIFSH